jgi:dihydropteroate synthase
MSLPWGQRTAVMGVINITPDSFSDGGLHLVPERALAQARRMVAMGVDLLDLGAQSTRPGADDVGVEEERRRLLPVLQLIAAAIASAEFPPELLISVDTFHAAVAEAALAAGADWINDVRGGSARRDPAMAPLVAASGCCYVLTHSRGDSAGMDALATYHDVVAEVRAELEQATEQLLAEGVEPGQILWDPGLGFAKTTEQNLELLRRLPELAIAGYPLLVGPSRKRFIGAVLEQPNPRQRLWGTAAVCAQAIARGADVLRVHDVGPIVQVARMSDALWRG